MTTSVRLAKTLTLIASVLLALGLLYLTAQYWRPLVERKGTGGTDAPRLATPPPRHGQGFDRSTTTPLRPDSASDVVSVIELHTKNVGHELHGGTTETITLERKGEMGWRIRHVHRSVALEQP